MKNQYAIRITQGELSDLPDDCDLHEVQDSMSRRFDTLTECVDLIKELIMDGEIDIRNLEFEPCMLSSETSCKDFKVGQRVRFTSAIDLYPHTIIEEGECGIVTLCDTDMLHIRLLKVHEGLNNKEWNNEYQLQLHEVASEFGARADYDSIEITEVRTEADILHDMKCHVIADLEQTQAEVKDIDSINSLIRDYADLVDPELVTEYENS